MKITVRYLRRWLTAAVLVGAAVLTNAAEMVEEKVDSELHSFRIVQLASGLHHPWAVAPLPDGRFLVSERRGRLALIENDKVVYIEGVPKVSALGQGGLLDLVLHPRYGDGEHDWIYMTYSKPGETGSATALARAKLKGVALTDFQELFVQDRYSQPGRHYGSRLAWRADGTLLMTIGDRGVTPERAQDKKDHAGSVLRLTETGTAPADNPFAGEDTGLDEIYSYGNRNIQGLVVAADGRIWASEHAALTGDELNLIEAGQNYGWPIVTRSKDYGTKEPIGAPSMPGVRDAQYIYQGRFAPSGLAQVKSNFFPEWEGNLLAGGLGSQKLLRIQLNGDKVVETEILLEGQLGRIRDVRQGPDGYIYLLNDTSDGGLYRLEPAG
ncbi:Glucose/arabinose dehydrogenase, beta-propeller fold [Microbulbifer thermotolerans]|uniref:PQQ-dependent sugar dehydrogenase n=1 Tax=Microbulbifer thermotolerans TaxID=252514 RepID=UPI0008ED54B6|nr:PQQ-dependent sugar dehydrogenase [Microbulbifer thermotolerans]MCX2833236.1 PQQ-dependent sugar dehydrogenase [Microbulbifer thermotolerans]SFC10974.1 Glucose/arabinose dehydrogenase, beta-propeller fold [Microbulbifer thermotolerans]